MSGHTPLPWRVSKATDDCNILADPEYMTARSVASTGGFASNMRRVDHVAENTANAAFIVTSVNTLTILATRASSGDNTVKRILMEAGLAESEIEEIGTN